ncbi:hypothetical protein LCI18_008003 [Fusarium solani-melongenae]|uniref:Uncharacterized protein n=1 Tax=Fusarium solani subsp. cucurbitae TaxID=2747967 RepID=A0ACD3ZAG8_FUSSC|nr:hypothetical protein LCI18_008003 [Fusarium solani-melongenae]
MQVLVKSEWKLNIGGRNIGGRKVFCLDCRKKAQELSDAVARLRSRSTTRKSPQVWMSFRHALQSVMSTRRINEQLEASRTQLHTATLVCLWEESKWSYGEDACIVEMKQKVDELAELVSELHSELHVDTPFIRIAPRDDAAFRGFDDIGNMYFQVQDEVIQQLWGNQWKPEHGEDSEVDQSIPAGWRSQALSTIVQPLKFDDFEKRHDAIPEAHQNTLQWIWQRQSPLSSDKSLWSSFPEWPEKDDSTFYWITGKPGSGKSTLMKYIQHHPNLKMHLAAARPTSQHLTIGILSFYAWNPGSNCQRSIEGLRRTILAYGLQQDPDVIPMVAPRRWAFCRALGGAPCPRDWDASEIETSLALFLSNCRLRMRLMVLIDGLDEFADSPNELIAAIIKMSEQGRGGIKICVASRPENEFMDYFGRFPCLAMHQLTAGDLEQFISQKFNSCLAYHERKPGAEQLQIMVLDKAGGVFLWVSVVTGFLIESLQRGDTTSELQDVIKDLPSEMSELYDRIWSRISEPLRMQAARTFLLKEASVDQKLHFLTLWIVDERLTERSLGPDRDITEAEVQMIRKTVSRRLHSRTHGLLEISPDDSIGYLHRTSHEWATKQNFELHTQGLNPAYALLDGLCLLGWRFPRASHIADTWRNGWDQHWRESMVGNMLYYAAQVVADPGRREEETEDFILWVRQFVEVTNTWKPGSNGRSFLQGWFHSLSPASSFLELAAAFGLTPLFKELFKMESHTTRHSQVLRFAIYFPDGPKAKHLTLGQQYWESSLFRPEVRLELVRLCLRHKATPTFLTGEPCSLRKLADEVQTTAKAKNDAELAEYFNQVADLLLKSRQPSTRRIWDGAKELFGMS